MTEKAIGVLITALADISHDGTVYGPGREAGVELRVTERQAERLRDMGFAKPAVEGVPQVKSDTVASADASADADAATNATAQKSVDPSGAAQAVAVADAAAAATQAAKKPAAKTVRKPKA